MFYWGAATRGSSVGAETGLGSRGLVRGIGLIGAGLVVLNSVIGAGIFALPAAIVARAGALSPWLFLGCGLLIVIIVLAWSELASYFRDSGGPVLYASAFGPLAGFTSGWIYFLSRMTAFAANTDALVSYLSGVWRPLESGVGRGAAIVAVGACLTLANYLGVREGVRTVGLLTVLKLAPLVLLIVLGLPHVTGDVLFPPVLPLIDDLGGTTLLLIYAYVGFEAVTITAGETTRPRRNLPRALLVTVAATAALYVLIVLVYVAVQPESAASDTALIELGRALAGSTGAALITAAAIFSIGGNLASNMLTVPRLTYALAEQRLLPAWFARVHPRYRTPGNSIVFLGVLATAFALTSSFLWLAAASSLTRLIVYAICIAALPVIRRRADPEARSRAFRLKGGYVIPAAALAMCAWMALQSAADAWRLTGILLLAGLALYLLAGRGRRPAA